MFIVCLSRSCSCLCLSVSLSLCPVSHFFSSCSSSCSSSLLHPSVSLAYEFCFLDVVVQSGRNSKMTAGATTFSTALTAETAVASLEVGVSFKNSIKLGGGSATATAPGLNVLIASGNATTSVTSSAGVHMVRVGATASERTEVTTSATSLVADSAGTAGSMSFKVGSSGGTSLQNSIVMGAMSSGAAGVSTTVNSGEFVVSVGATTATSGTQLTIGPDLFNANVKSAASVLKLGVGVALNDDTYQFRMGGALSALAGVSMVTVVGAVNLTAAASTDKGSRLSLDPIVGSTLTVKGETTSSSASASTVVYNNNGELCPVSVSLSLCFFCLCVFSVFVSFLSFLSLYLCVFLSFCLCVFVSFCFLSVFLTPGFLFVLRSSSSECGHRCYHLGHGGDDWTEAVRSRVVPCVVCGTNERGH